MDHNFTI